MAKEWGGFMIEPSELLIFYHDFAIKFFLHTVKISITFFLPTFATMFVEFFYFYPFFWLLLVEIVLT